ncbi:hypothetical protein [Streptomyces gilvosporeus]|nr:hypothetical protein [Streptomyces gilvosporeus]
MAALVFQVHLRKAGIADRVSVTSAGTGAWHTGKRIDERAAHVLSARGYPVHHVAAQLGQRDLDANLFVAMDSSHVAALKERLRAAECSEVPEADERIRLLRSFSPE